MARYIQRPDNALKRANEFIEVGKPARALDTLQEVFRNKKFSYTWSEQIIEPIMFKYLDLCVELKKSHIAKEGLFQYRNMYQLVNVGSLENVIRGYLKMAEERTEAAQQQSSQAVLDIDDLDNLATPESILLMSAVCGEDAQDRSDRTILLPWVKFLWESYCQCLELLRVNSHCEILYHDIARMAFHFCLKYNRKMEFRKLSEKLRKHLDDIGKVSAQSSNVSITKPETQQLNLDTRLYQLDSAIQMELWQEAYKAIEDIHGLMTLSKKQPQPKTMANYYQKLAMVFWKAGNQLFHAAALLRLFQLSRELKKTITNDEIQRMASHVLVATLAIPLPSAHPEYDRFIETDKSPLEKAQRLAVLLGLQQPPTRASLLREIIRANVFNLALPHFQNLHKWLEVDYNPLSLCSNVQTVIDYIKSDEKNPLLQYIDSLQNVTLVRLVRQVSQVYQTIEFARFLELAKFATTFKLERILVDCVRHNDMQITIDHKEKMVMFGTDLSESQREDHHDGPILQSMPSEQVRQQLVNMSVVLHRAIAAINPNRQKGEREALRAQMVALYHENKVREHQAILIRQKLIEDRKEKIERLNQEREEEEVRRHEEQVRQQKLVEQQRLEKEAEEREKKRSENERKQIRNRTMMEKIQQISQTTHGQKMLKIIEEKGAAVDPDELAKEEKNALIRERKELTSKLKSQEKKVDYYERAKRIEEVPLIKDYLKDMEVKEEVFWQNQEKNRIENAIAERKNAVTQQERLKRMHADREAYMNQLKAERKNLYLDKLRAFNEALEEERKRRLAQRIVERRKERRDKWLAEREAEKQRKLDEIQREKDEQLRLEKEQRAKEREAELEKLNIQSEKQKQREAEAERKIQEDRERARARDKPMRDSEHSAWRSVGGKDGGARESVKEGAWRTAQGSDNDNTSGGGKWRTAGDRNDDRGGFRRGDDDRGGYRDRDGRNRRDDRDSFIKRSGGNDGPIRRSGDDAPIRRSGDDAPIRRSGDDAPMRRGGDDKDSYKRGDDRSFKRGDDRGPKRDDRGPMRRGGDSRSGPIKRSGYDDSSSGGGGNWRQRDDSDRPKDEASSWRRAEAPRDDKDKQ
ncbi:CLUMA_CG001825, isoform A [Clunio marinus]|uniref:Eukaryotic translation initiation factor 3 subunit A n=1 Tax=Clunio marinus TaxID=568069 RepID=A0A1J1HJ35_9DIPT|nr:CLUMA_CG001825, isoform A [Clunio marinus]